MITWAQAFKRKALHRIRSTSLVVADLRNIESDSLQTKDFKARQFAVFDKRDEQKEHSNALQRLTDASKVSWSFCTLANDVDQSLPFGKGKRFYNRRIVEALKLGDLHRAWAVMEILHRRHAENTVLWPYTYNLLLRHLCIQQKTLLNTNLKQILSLLDIMVTRRCADQRSFQIAMAACSRARNLRGANHVLEGMKAGGIMPDARIYSFLINCCARKQGFVKTAEKYLDDMLTTKVNPTVFVINSLLRVYSRDRGRSKEMLNLIHRAFVEYELVSDTITSRTMVHYLLHEGDVGSAVTYLREIENEIFRIGMKFLPVKRKVVNFVIDACRQRGDWTSAQYALSLLGKVDEKNVIGDIDGEVQNSMKLKRLVANRDALSFALDRPRDWSQMTQLQYQASVLDRSQNESVERALEKSYHQITELGVERFIHGQSLNLQGKLKLLNELIRLQKASAHDFSTVLEACGRQGQVDDALSVLNKMKSYAKMCPLCAPTTWSYNALLNAFAVRGEVHKMESILNEMIMNDLHFDQVTVNTVLKAQTNLLKECVDDTPKTRLSTMIQALSIYEQCVEYQNFNSDVSTYFSLFRLFATYLNTCNNEAVTNAYKDGVSLHDSAEHNEIDSIESQEKEVIAYIKNKITATCRDAPAEKLDIGVFNNAFDCYYRLGDVAQSFKLFEFMKRLGFQPTDTTFGLIFATCATQQQFEVGLNFLDHLMTNDGYKPSLKVLIGAMQLCAKSNNPEGAIQLFRAIEASNAFTLTVEAYEPVAFAYARVGNVNSAWEIVNEMEEKLGSVFFGSYNWILQACAVAALPGRALEVLDVMRREKGVAPDVISYNTCLDAFVRAGQRAAWWKKNRVNKLIGDREKDHDEVEEAAEKDTKDLKGSVEGSPSIKRVIDAKNVEVTAALNMQRTKAAWARASVIDILEKMQLQRLKPDMTTYERAIGACSVNEDNEGVIAIFDKLITRTRSRFAFKFKSNLVSESSFSAYLVASTALQDKNRVLEAPTLLRQWHLATRQAPSEFVVAQLLESLELLGEWRCAVQMLPEWKSLFGVRPSVVVFNKVMEMCNRANEHELVAPIFATMQDATANHICPNPDSYIERIYAEEQLENWGIATNLFVEMRKKFTSEEISHRQLQKLSLGRYSLRHNEHKC
ncbi:hypothetical protein CCR75_008033 [Bremia lactucae]|uniref:PROP1-like PPR domain-containing protein n=1 Tax=Bremia lactucae TaxID=4779 RepID=A0A976IBG7_BRELC|nr:hypothetical protein CCR75_008033 [Bremia lactucae]